MDEFDLPDGIKSTNDYMAINGSWTDLPDAIKVLETLLQHIKDNSVRFGLLKNHHAAVVTELTEVLAFAKTHRGDNAKFNFSVIM